MSVKILNNKPREYTPVTIELTFDTLEQLKVFVSLYGNSNALPKPLKTLEDSEVSDMETHQIASAIESTIDFEVWASLKNIAGSYII